MRKILAALGLVALLPGLLLATSALGPLGSYEVASGTTDGYIVFPSHAPFSLFNVLASDNDILIRWSTKDTNLDDAEWLTLPASVSPRQFYVPKADTLEYDRTAATVLTVWAELEQR